MVFGCLECLDFGVLGRFGGLEVWIFEGLDVWFFAVWRFGVWAVWLQPRTGLAVARREKLGSPGYFHFKCQTCQTTKTPNFENEPTIPKSNPEKDSKPPNIQKTDRTKFKKNVFGGFGSLVFGGVQ